MDFLQATSAATLAGPDALSISAVSESGEESDAEADDIIMSQESVVSSAFESKEESELTRAGRVLCMVWSMLQTLCGATLKAAIE